MYQPPKGIFEEILEIAFLFALSMWLIRTGICLLGQVWVPVIILIVVTVSVIVGLRIWRHYKDTHF